MLRYSGHIGWNISKIISRLISVDFSSLHRPQRHGSSTKGTPQNFGRSRGGADNTRHSIVIYLYIVLHSDLLLFIYLFNVLRYNTGENNITKGNRMPLTGDNSTMVASIQVTLLLCSEC